VSADRLGPLRRAKLRALVRDNPAAGSFDPAVATDVGLPGGATLHDPSTGAGWVLLDDGAIGGFGAALAWARKAGVAPLSALSVLVEDRVGATPGRSPSGAVQASAVVARRAGEFAEPPAVWRVADRLLVAAMPAPAVAPDGDDARFGGLADEIRAHGADPVVEHGLLLAEVLGLEVARAVPDGGGAWRLDVGVGHHDREARHELRPDQSIGDALDEVVGVVRTWRVPGGQRHPATMLARERWLRAAVMARPDVVGARSLQPVAGPVPPGDLRRPAPAAALGTSEDGGPLLVVCSTGVDVDLVPTAADTRLLHAPDAELVLVVPEGDDYPLTRDLAAALRHPAAVRTVDADWTALLR
jgi:hypothetical protein